MQVLMRRPEIHSFIAVAPPANMYDFTFLAPCPSSGLVLRGDKDDVVPPSAVDKLIDKLRQQKGITIDLETISGANHFFHGKIDKLDKQIGGYIDRAMSDEGEAAK
jgi:alpha/beta superfamily hydrolase